MNKTLEYYLTLKYQLTITQDDDGSYFAEYPDLKGCMTCGDTIVEASEMAEDAKRAWLETAIEQGVQIPEPKSESDYSGSFRLRIPKSLHKTLADEAKKEGISMNQYCLYLLSKEYERTHCGH